MDGFNCFFFLQKTSIKGSEDTAAGAKRHTPITFNDNNSSPPKQKKTSKEAKELYTPPSGKYSNKVTSYSKYITQIYL